MSKLPEIPIEGGYYIKARVIKHKKIAHAAPHVREIWDYCLREANHKPRKYKCFIVERGQLFRSYKEIRESLHWEIGWRKMTYSENQMKNAMRFLREHEMITTQRKPGGVLITICNYDFYQDSKNYKQPGDYTKDYTNEKPLKNYRRPSNNNNVNNVNNEKNKDEDAQARDPEPTPELLPDFNALLENQDSEIQAILKKMRDFLGLTDYEIQQFHANNSTEKLREAVEITIDATENKIKREGTALENPGAYLKSILKNGAVSLKTRTEQAKKHLSSKFKPREEVYSILTEALEKHPNEGDKTQDEILAYLREIDPAIAQAVSRTSPYFHSQRESNFSVIYRRYTEPI